jgi:2-phosphosulfolactate phosphatase
MEVSIVAGLSGAAASRGPTVIIDVFRAFSTAAYAFEAGAARIVLADAIDEARRLRESIPGSIVMGEDRGVKPAGFDLNNSPGEIRADPERVRGRTVIHRTTSGTRCARVASANGAGPILGSSLVVATATAAALADEDRVTIVASGLAGTSPALEDQIAAEAIAAALDGDRALLAGAGSRVAATERARELEAAGFIHPDDIGLCSAVDRFDFAMEARDEAGLLVLRPVSGSDRRR